MDITCFTKLVLFCHINKRIFFNSRSLNTDNILTVILSLIRGKTDNSVIRKILIEKEFHWLSRPRLKVSSNTLDVGRITRTGGVCFRRPSSLCNSAVLARQRRFIRSKLSLRLVNEFIYVTFFSLVWFRNWIWFRLQVWLTLNSNLCIVA